MSDGMRSRKFWMACFILFVSAIGLFWSLIDGGTWVAASSLCLGIYGAANVMEKKQ
jgi:hypothetical protein